MKKGVRKEIYNEFVLLFDAECLIIPSMDYCDILSHILISFKIVACDSSANSHSRTSDIVQST